MFLHYPHLVERYTDPGGIMMRMAEGKTLAAAPWQVRAVLVLLPLFFSAVGIAIAIRLNDRGDKWADALATWAIGWFFALATFALWELARGRPLFGRSTSEQPRWKRSEIIVIAIVLLTAVCLRVVALEEYPVALHNDEMSCMIEARDFLWQEQGMFDIGWFNCPNLGFFLTSLSLRALGQTLFALRFASVLLGLLSLIAAYLLVRRLFGVRPALLLLIMTTPFHWHLHYSRTGFHYMQAASLTAVAIWLFVIAFDRRSPVLFGCAGVVTGIACQTYYAAWLTPSLLVGWALVRALTDRRLLKTAIKGSAVTIALLVVTLAPLLAFYAKDLDYMAARPNDVYLFSSSNSLHVAEAYGTTNPARLLVKNAGRLLGLFFGGFGDGAKQYGLQHPFIDPFLLLLFLGGLAYAVTLIRTAGGQLLWIWFLGTVVAGGLLTIDAPFSPRLIGIVPIVLLFPALLIDWILRLPWVDTRRWRTTGITVLTAALIAGSAWWSLHVTFVRYPREHDYHARDYIARLALDLRWVRSVASVDVPEQFDHQAYTALIPHIERTNIDTWNTPHTNPADLVKKLGSRTLVIVPLHDTGFVELFEQLGATSAGTVMAHKEPHGFRWAYIERRR